jgi:hypothetical protein
VSAAVAVAREHGVEVREPCVLSDRSNLMIRLGPPVRPAPTAVWTALLAGGHPELRERAEDHLSRWAAPRRGGRRSSPPGTARGYEGGFAERTRDCLL